MARRRHEIPTHLNVEDKAFAGLSVRQVMNLIVGVSTAYSIWNAWPGLPLAVRGGLAGACLIVSLILTLVRPGGVRSRSGPSSGSITWQHRSSAPGVLVSRTLLTGNSVKAPGRRWTPASHGNAPLMLKRHRRSDEQARISADCAAQP